MNKNFQPPQTPLTGRELLGKIYAQRQKILVAHSLANPILEKKPPVDRWSAYNTLTEAKKKKYVTDAYDHTFGIVGKDNKRLINGDGDKNAGVRTDGPAMGKTVRSWYTPPSMDPGAGSRPDHFPMLWNNDQTMTGDSVAGGNIRHEHWGSPIPVVQSEVDEREARGIDSGDLYDDEWGGLDNQ